MKGAYCLSNAGWASRPPAVGKLGVIVCSWLGSVQWMKSELNSKVFSCIRLSKSSLKSCFKSFRTCLEPETKEKYHSLDLLIFFRTFSALLEKIEELLFCRPLHRFLFSVCSQLRMFSWSQQKYLSKRWNKQEPLINCMPFGDCCLYHQLRIHIC